MRVTNTIALGIMLLLVLLLQGCGRKGPLFLQQMAPPPVPSVAPAPLTPESSPSAQSSVPISSTLQNSTEPVKQP